MKPFLFCCILILIFNAAILAETGLASWYGGKFHGRRTASGEIFNTYELTAAHKTLPFNTLVKVTNRKNEKSVIVRINDRGPFIEGRIIDLSRAAAARLDMLNDGTVPVQLEIIGAENRRTGETSTIQISSFRNKEYALALQNELLKAGIRTILEDSGSGYTRVIIPNIPTPGLSSLVEDLKSLGYGNLLIRSK